MCQKKNQPIIDMKNVVGGGFKKGNLVTILYVTPEDVEQILNVHSRTGHFLQSHCVTQDQRQRLSPLPSPYSVGSILQVRHNLKHKLWLRMRSGAGPELVYLDSGVSSDT